MWKANRFFISVAASVAVALALVSCGTGKQAVDATSSASTLSSANGESSAARRELMQKVYANRTDADGMSSKIKFTLNDGKKDISVSGTLRMKKDEVIRIQLTPLGLVEVGRIEFATDYVLIMDRMNKEYVKAGYADVAFLRNNSLDFYALQALFWNRLFIPGSKEVTESSLGKFSVAQGDNPSTAAITLNRGRMNYRWNAETATGRLTSVSGTYAAAASGATTLNCSYSSFKPFEGKQFPTDITLSMQSDVVKKAAALSINISISKLDTDTGWDTFTSVSSKYRQVSLEEVLAKLVKL